MYFLKSIFIYKIRYKIWNNNPNDNNKYPLQRWYYYAGARNSCNNINDNDDGAQKMKNVENDEFRLYFEWGFWVCVLVSFLFSNSHSITKSSLTIHIFVYVLNWLHILCGICRVFHGCTIINRQKSTIKYNTSCFVYIVMIH